MAREARSGPDKEGAVIKSSMHRKASAFLLLGASALSFGAAAAGVAPPRIGPVLPAAIQTAVRPVPVPVPPAPPPASFHSVSPALSGSLARWNSLRQSDAHPFSSYASFLHNHRGWPGEAAMRRAAEKADTAGSPPSQIVVFFRSFPPLTASGHARL